MMKDDEAARKARAKRLHEQIDEIAGGGESIPAAQDPLAEAPAPSPLPHESPREFIHRRMRELKEQEPNS